MTPRTLMFLAAAVALIAGLLIGSGASHSGGKEATQVVSLAYAEQWGAAQWDTGLREQFLNDPDNRVRLSREDVQKRNDQGPEEWLPASGQCDYIGKSMAMMERYKLHHRHEKWQDLRVKRQRCYTRFQ